MLVIAEPRKTNSLETSKSQLPQVPTCRRHLLGFFFLVHLQARISNLRSIALKAAISCRLLRPMSSIPLAYASSWTPSLNIVPFRCTPAFSRTLFMTKLKRTQDKKLFVLQLHTVSNGSEWLMVMINSFCPVFKFCRNTELLKCWLIKKKMMGVNPVLMSLF